MGIPGLYQSYILTDFRSYSCSSLSTAFEDNFAGSEWLRELVSSLQMDLPYQHSQTRSV